MNSQHTPGDWVAVAQHAPSRQTIETADFSRHIATVEGHGPQVEADARLIAAAPAMRAILDRIVNADPVYEDADDGRFCTFCMAHADRSGRVTHAARCEWTDARALLARIDGETR